MSKNKFVAWVKPVPPRKEIERKPEPKVIQPDFDAKVKRNEWETNLDEVVATIKELSNPDSFEWSWARNWDCKYIGLRFDMRDGAFVMTDNTGKRISLAELRYQYRSENDAK